MSVAITQHRTVPVAINKDEPNKYQQRILLSDVRRHNCHFAVVGLLSVCVTDLKFQTRSRFFSVFLLRVIAMIPHRINLSFIITFNILSC